MDIIKRDINLQRPQDRAVCLATIAQNGCVIAIADKVRASPQTSKIIPLTESILFMVSGESPLIAEIIGDLKDHIAAQEGDEEFLVKEWAESYVACLQHIQDKRISREFLAPHGLTKETFIDKQNLMVKEFFFEIANQIKNYRNASVCSALITGIDRKGSHIYMVNDSRINCQSSLGFGAIGEGSPHAISEFMFAKHDPTHPVDETLLLSYRAKKGSEVALTVGQLTDVWMIHPHTKKAAPLDPALQTALEKEYETFIQKEQEAWCTAQQEIHSLCLEKSFW